MKMNQLAVQPLQTFEDWLIQFDKLCCQYMGVSYRALPEQDLEGWYQDGLTPKIACFQMMQNLDAADIYYQEFDTFSDADSGL